jgi:hypothetical protein
VIQYYEVADCLAYLLDLVDAAVADQMRAGLVPVISGSSHIDEYGTAGASEGAYCISASVAVTRKIADAISRIDLQALTRILEQSPPKDRDSLSIFVDLDSEFLGFIGQVAHVINEAVKRGYGLLGHIG